MECFIQINRFVDGVIKLKWMLRDGGQHGQYKDEW
jgi:hypothetical protein